jgi:hypothetical protein
MTAEHYTLAITVAAITLAVTTFYGIRNYTGAARRWYVATMLFGGLMGIVVAWGTDIRLSLAFTIGLGAYQLITPLRRLFKKYTGS